MSKVTNPALLAELNSGGQAAPVPAGQAQALPMGSVNITSPVATNARVLQNRRDQAALDQIPLQQENIRSNIDQTGRQIVSSKFDDETKLRKEYNEIPIIKMYPTMVSTYASALSTPDTPAGDHQLIVLATKLNDFGTAAMQGEVTSTRNTLPIFEQLLGQFSKQLQGEGELGIVGRRNLREAAHQMMGQQNKSYTGQRVRYKDLATEHNFNPQSIVGDHAGIPFQSVEEKFTGKPTPDADYRGNVIQPDAPEFDRSGELPFTDPTLKADMQLPTGSTVAGELPPGMQEEYNSFLQSVPRGKMTVERFRETYSKLNQKYGMASDESTYADFVKAYNDPKRRISATIPPPTREMGAVEEVVSDAQQTPLGTGVMNFLNDASLGIPEALGGDAARTRMGLLNEENPLSAFAGSLVGGLAGSASLQGAGTLALGKIAPKLLQGGERLAFGGRVLRDASAGGITQANKSREEDRLMNALMGAGLGTAGAAGGQFLAKGVSPLASAESKAAIAELGDTDLTTLQRLGKTAAKAEQVLQGLPIVRGARSNSQESFITNTGNRALSEIGTKVPKNTAPGNETVKAVGDQLGAKYDTLFPQIQGVADPGFVRIIKAIKQKPPVLSDDAKAQLQLVEEEAARAFDNNGAYTGQSYGTTISELRKISSSLHKDESVYMQRVGEIADQYISRLQRLARRQNPAVARELAATDKGYSKLVIMERAAAAASNDGGVFSPAQYMQAIKGGDSSVRKRAVSRGTAKEQDYAKAALDILGKKVPDSPSLFAVLGAGAGGAVGSLTNPGITASVIPAATAAYAPGVKRLTQALFSKKRAPEVQNLERLGAALLQANNNERK